MGLCLNIKILDKPYIEIDTIIKLQLKHGPSKYIFHRKKNYMNLIRLEMIKNSISVEKGKQIVRRTGATSWAVNS